MNILNSAADLAGGLAEKLEDQRLQQYYDKVSILIKNSMVSFLENTKQALIKSENRREFIKTKEIAIIAIQNMIPPADMVQPDSLVIELIKSLHFQLINLFNLIDYYPSRSHPDEEDGENLEEIQKKKEENKQNIQAIIKRLFQQAKEIAQSIKSFIPNSGHPEQLQHACYKLINNNIQYLINLIVENNQKSPPPLTLSESFLSLKNENKSPEEKFKIQLEKTLLANSQILCYIIPNLPDVFIANKSKLSKILLRFQTSCSKDSFNQVIELINEQILITQAIFTSENDSKKRRNYLQLSNDLIRKFIVFKNIFLDSYDEKRAGVDDESKLQILIKLNEIKAILEKIIALTNEKKNSNFSVDIIDRLANLSIPNNPSSHNLSIPAIPGSAEANANDENNSIVSQLYETARKIAMELKKLTKPITPAELIICVRKITQQIHSVVKLTQSFSMICHDKRLCEQLAGKSVAARTKSVQLKILCAVKAASCTGIINFGNYFFIFGHFFLFCQIS